VMLTTEMVPPVHAGSSTLLEVSMRHRWLAVVLLACAALAGYAAGTTPVSAQGEALPFQVGDSVIFTFQDDGSRRCRIEEVRGTFARCGAAIDRFGPRPEPSEFWVNVAVVESITRSPERR
jgi:hypothetical protein